MAFGVALIVGGVGVLLTGALASLPRAQDPSKALFAGSNRRHWKTYVRLGALAVAVGLVIVIVTRLL